MPKQLDTSVDEPRHEPSEAGKEPAVSDDDAATAHSETSRPREYGGRKGPDPVRYGDWEKNGRCIDF